MKLPLERPYGPGGRPGVVLTLVALSAPFFVLRVPGTSFSLVDLCVLIGAVPILLRAFLQPSSFSWLTSVSTPQVPQGSAFLVACLLSGVEGSMMGSVPFSTWEFATSVLQYAFVLILMPLVACSYLTPERLWWFLRMVALGYVVPMAVTVLLMHPRAPESARSTFFLAGRARGSFENANAFAGVLNLLTPVYAVLGVADRGVWRLLGTVGLGLLLLCLVLTASFGGVLVLLAMVAANIVLMVAWPSHPFRLHKGRSIGFLAVVVLILVSTLGTLLSSPWTKGQIERRLELVRQQPAEKLLREGSLGSASKRIVLVEEAWEMIQHRAGGLWGHGLGQSAAESRFSQPVHVTYLLFWIEGGLLLLLAYLAYLAGLFRNVRALARRQPVVAAATGLGVVALVLLGGISPHVYLRFYWVPLMPAFVNWDAYACGPGSRPG